MSEAIWGVERLDGDDLLGLGFGWFVVFVSSRGAMVADGAGVCGRVCYLRWERNSEDRQRPLTCKGNDVGLLVRRIMQGRQGMRDIYFEAEGGNMK